MACYECDCDKKITKCMGVQGVGLAAQFPPSPQFFTETSVTEVIKIPEQKPDICDLLSITVDAEIISMRLVRTAEGFSNEGQRLTGWKLIVELKIRQKVKYVACDDAQSVHAAHFEKVVSSIFIVVPPLMPAGGALVPIETLFNQGRLVVTPYIEDIFGLERDTRTIFKNITLFLNVTAV